jgi:membrane protein DedA with SNARE-associated domain
MLATTAGTLFLTPALTLASVESILLDSSHVTSYVLIALLLLSSGVGAPIPEDIPLLVGGWLCALEQAKLWLMLPLAWFFVLAGDSVLYFLGRRYGHHVPRLPGLSRVLTPQRIQRTEQFFQQHGGKTLFFVRFLAIVRASTWFVAGALRIPFWKFVAYDGVAALIFAPGLVLIGYMLGPRSEEIGHIVRWAQLGLTALVFIAVLAAVAWHMLRRRTEPAP